MSESRSLDPADLERFKDRHVVVVGDAILDRYWQGAVSRISPEAPVPVVRWEEEDERAGGSANVALNVVSLGARASLVAVVGDDDAASRLARLIHERGVGDGGLVRVPGRASTVKTRILARHQQIVRLDREDDRPLPDAAAAAVADAALRLIGGADALVVSDYAKGTLDARTLRPILDAARAAGVPAVVDPKIRNMAHYGSATVLTPNESEASRAAALDTCTREGLGRAARELLGRLAIDAVLVTRGERGMLLVQRDGSELAIDAIAREVYDVTGAGDTVVATLGVALAAGLGLEAAARWANAAGALAVGRLGTAAISRDDLAALAPSG